MYSDYNFGDEFYTYEGDTGFKTKKYKIMAPPQEQATQPGLEYLMEPAPLFDDPEYKGSGKLKDKVAVIVYYDEHEDAYFTKRYIEGLGGKCLLISGDLSKPSFSWEIVDKTLRAFGKIDILVNNAGVQYQSDRLEDISEEQFDYTMRVNVYGMFYLTKAVLPNLKSGSSIINLSSVTTFYGDAQLIDYVTSKGAIVGFTRALARNLATRNIRVNAIAPGFFWTPLQPGCWQREKIPSLGADSAMGRGAMPYELAPTFVFLYDWSSNPQ